MLEVNGQCLTEMTAVVIHKATRGIVKTIGIHLFEGIFDSGVEVVVLRHDLSLGVDADGIGANILVEVAEDMPQSITDAWIALVSAYEVVVVIGGSVFAIVLIMHGTRVQQTGLVVVVDVAVADRQITAANGQVDESVPVFLVSLVLTIHVTVVHPDVV